ncbi:MAG: response regulator [Oscillospiraceae bacterium]|nr:response regulator [Oscillospiraceae bacterium]
MNSRNLSFGKRFLIMVICIALNFGGKFLAESLVLPLWLDTIGTFAAAYFFGIGGAVIAGVCNNLIYAIFEIEALPYMLSSSGIGIFLALCMKKRNFESFTKAMLVGFWTGVISVVVSVPVNMIFSEGKSGNEWGDIFFSMLEWYGTPRVICSIGDELIVDIIDKMVTAAIAYAVIKITVKIIDGKKMRASKASAAVLALAIAGGTLFMCPFDVSAESNSDKYISTVYNNKNGLCSSEANEIAQTEDGYIWIGGYAGLTRFNGKSFEFITEGGITSVTAMFTDSRGRLWIGTNDSGVALYESGSFSFYNIKSGLAANSVRCFAEADDGTVYIGTTDRICKVLSDNSVSVIDTDVTYIISMVYYGGKLVCVNNSGKLFVIENDSVVTEHTSDTEGVYYTCVGAVSDGIMAGTSSSYIEKISVSQSGVKITRKRILETLSGVQCMKSDSRSRLWLCCSNGIGYLRNGTVKELFYDGFDSGIENVLEDYQGNIWFASSRYGIMKLSDNTFGDLFEESGAASAVTNSVCLYNGDFYCGTDSGLVIIDEKSRATKSNNLTEMLEGARIRCIKTDSQNRLWICTYSDYGLVRYEADGTIKTFTEKENGTTSDRFRCIIELPDGTVAAGTNSGLNFIKDDKVTGTIRQADGLENAQILCLALDSGGNLYAGSDGAGIYIIRDGRIIGHIGETEGMPSQVVLRMTPYGGGFFLVMSNSLGYMKDGAVTSLNKFPYYNNYDAVVMNEKLCVISSAGIYITDIEELLSGNDISYKLYNYYDGLSDGLVSNSWNYLDEDGMFYFSTNRGVNYFKPDYQKRNEAEYKFGLSAVSCDKNKAEINDDVIVIPADTKLITLEASVRNYLASNVKLRFFIKELNDNPPVITHRELESIQISNLEHGTYTVCIQIMSDDESAVLQEKCYCLVKEAHAWENDLFRSYLIIAIVWIGSAIVWVIVTTSMMIKHENEIARLKYQAKSEFLANMSHEFRTPVNTILGMNEIILQDDPGDRITECSENIKTASNSLLTLINDVLDFSAIESGTLELVSESYDLDRLLNEEIAALNYAAGKKGIETVFVVDDNLPAQLEGDFHRVKQIIDNLISNAVKFTDNGQIAFFAGGEINAGSDFSLIITLSDTGSGISEEDKEKLFDSFDRLRHNKNRTVGGTGLGLSITKALVEMMNGTVTVKSVVGSGSVFTVKLPQKISGNSIIESFSCDSRIKHDTAARCFTIPDAHILAVDDNRMNLSVLGGLLKRYGIAPDIATGGNECMELCRKNKYDLIIMDHMMPSPDGIETMHAIRGDEDNPNRESSIVVLTANAVAGAKQRYIDEGFDDYLSKPVDIAALERVLLTYIPEGMVCEDEPVPNAPANAEPALNETAPNEYDPYIDRRVGMKYCGNDEGLYSEIIESYCEEGKKYRRQLKEYFDKADWKNYAVIAHTLKSTSLNIGARGLSELAEVHEFAAKAEDAEAVAESFDRFTELLETVLDAAEKMIYRKERTVLEEVTAEEYTAMLGRLLENVNNYEMTEAIDCIEKMRGCTTADGLSERAGEMLSKVQQLVDDFDYITASELIESFVSEKLK